MIWAIERKMNKEVYLNKIIKTEIIPTAMSVMVDDFIFQQDGAIQLR